MAESRTKEAIKPLWSSKGHSTDSSSADRNIRFSIISFNVVIFLAEKEESSRCVNISSCISSVSASEDTGCSGTQSTGRSRVSAAAVK